MMLLCKMTYVSFFYSDDRLKELPSLIDYLGYLYFFPSATIGPVFPYEVYENFIEEKVIKNIYIIITT